MSRWYRLCSSALILAWLPVAAGAAAQLPAARDLQADGAQLRARRIPILVLYAQADCRWCERVTREYLGPMQADARYRQRVLLRRIAIDSDRPLTDFGGRNTTQRTFSAFEGVSVTPTVVLYGPDGARLGEPIVGFRTPDFYGAYIERAIDDGLAALSRESR